MTREQILDAAKQIVCNDREGQYGSPEDNFSLIAKLWSAILDCPLTPAKVAELMVCVKLARIATGAHKDDNWVDIAGYAACGGEIGGAGT